MPSYTFYHWGPLLFKIKMKQEDLKKCKLNFVAKHPVKLMKPWLELLNTNITLSLPTMHKILNPYSRSFSRSLS